MSLDTLQHLVKLPTEHYHQLLPVNYFTDNERLGQPYSSCETMNNSVKSHSYWMTPYVVQRGICPPMQEVTNVHQSGYQSRMHHRQSSESVQFKRRTRNHTTRPYNSSSRKRNHKKNFKFNRSHQNSNSTDPSHWYNATSISCISASGNPQPSYSVPVYYPQQVHLQNSNPGSNRITYLPYEITGGNPELYSDGLHQNLTVFDEYRSNGDVLQLQQSSLPNQHQLHPFYVVPTPVHQETTLHQHELDRCSEIAKENVPSEKIAQIQQPHLGNMLQEELGVCKRSACMICKEELSQVATVPCMHCVLCRECAISYSDCPLCGMSTSSRYYLDAPEYRPKTVLETS